MSNTKIYSKQFWLLCASSALFFSSFNMVIPELPNYLTSLGGGDYKGFIILLFTIAAMISRPFSGKLSDTIGRRPVMLFGAFICIIIGAMYPLFTTVVGFFVLRFLHGFSTGFNPTGVSAVVADLIPFQRRGEAMGILGLFTSTGMAIGPSVGPIIKENFSINTLFLASAFVGLISVVAILMVKETLKNPKKFSLKELKIDKHDFFERRTLGPAVVFMLTTFSFGAALTISPDFSEHLGVANKGFFFTIYVVASLMVRLIAGKLSDKHGRVPILMVATLLLATSMYLLGTSTGPNQFYFSAFLFGIAVGMNSPTIFAWTIDLSKEESRGRGLSTMYIGLELGIGMGAYLSAALYQNNVENFDIAFGACGFLSVLAFVYLLYWKKIVEPKYFPKSS